MARFVRNPTFDREIQDEPEFIAGMTATTTHVAGKAAKAAPDKTGYYKRRVKAFSRVEVSAVDAPVEALPKGKGYVVVATDPFGHLVEAGSANNDPYAPLQRGARAAGLRLIEEPKK